MGTAGVAGVGAGVGRGGVIGDGGGDGVGVGIVGMSGVGGVGLVVVAQALFPRYSLRSPCIIECALSRFGHQHGAMRTMQSEIRMYNAW